MSADAIARGLALRAAALGDRRVVQDAAGTLPAGLGWDTAHWPLSFGMSVPAAGRRVGWCSLSFDGLFPGWRTRTIVYCDGTAGSDGNSGLTAALAVKSLSKAITVANGLADAAVTIRVAAGLYYRAGNFLYNLTYPTKDIVFYAYGGRAVVTSADALTFAAYGSSLVTWQVALANCTGVADLASRDALGRYTMLTQVASAALCDALPGSWALVSGTLYVHRADGAQPVAGNARVYRPQDVFQTASSGDTQYNIGFTGDTDVDGFDFEGGNIASVSVVWGGGTVPAQPKVFAMRNCSLRYAGAQTGAAGLIRVYNHHGLVFLDSCAFGVGVTDSINVHLPATGIQTYLLTLNCSAHDSGSNAYLSCNAWTMHESAVGIDICGDYQRAKGATFHIINSARALVFGTAIGGSQGDLQAGGGVPPAELRANDTAEIWADAAVLTPNGAPGYEMWSTSRIHLRNMPAARSPRIQYAGGVIDSW